MVTLVTSLLLRLVKPWRLLLLLVTLLSSVELLLWLTKASAGTGHFTEVLNGIGTTLLVLSLLLCWSFVACFYRTVRIVPILRYNFSHHYYWCSSWFASCRYHYHGMAVGAAYLAKKQAIVQKLSAIESLAGVEILCSDKTGTLTKNKLSLHEPYTVEGVEPDDLMLTACLAASRKKKGLDD